MGLPLVSDSIHSCELQAMAPGTKLLLKDWEKKWREMGMRNHGDSMGYEWDMFHIASGKLRELWKIA